MANISNVNRLATSRVLLTALDHLKACAGLTIQAHRAYESPSRRGAGLTQELVAANAKTKPNTVSKLETGKTIPRDPALKNILPAAGFDMTEPSSSGIALLGILTALRDNKRNLNKIKTDRPQ